MLIVTHEMAFARDVADRVIFMTVGHRRGGYGGDDLRCAPRRADTDIPPPHAPGQMIAALEGSFRPFVLQQDLCLGVGCPAREHGRIAVGPASAVVIARGRNRALFLRT